MAATGAELEADLALLREAAAEAGRIAMRYFRKNPKVSFKEGMSPVTEADLHANTCLRQMLMAARPGYGWLSEETEDSAERLSRRRTFVVDPIDGTKAFIDGRDLWCVSAAIVEDGESIAGVLDCPVRGEMFTAAKGLGSFLNGHRLAIAAPRRPVRLSGAKTLVTAYAAAAGETPEQTGHIPSLAYRIAMIADSRLDGAFIKPNARDWDLAAADLILAEAGGEIRRKDGSKPVYGRADTAHGALVAGNTAITPTMWGVVAQNALL